MKILRVGDRVEAGNYRLHSRFRRVANYLLEAGRPRPASLLCLVAPSIGAGPINLVVEGDLPEADSLIVEPQALVIGPGRFAFDASLRYDSTLPGGSVNENVVPVLADHLRTKAHPKSLAFLLDDSRTAAFRDGFEQNMVRQVQAGARALFGEDPAHGAQMLKGCGLGLTPAGDDFLAGVLIGLHLAWVGRVGPTRRSDGLSQAALPIEIILAAALGDNVLSAAFLELAHEGRVNEAMKQLIITLTGKKAENVRAAADRVLAQGETSGADVLTGLVLAMQKVHSTSKNQRPTSND
ncbi:MAG: DUF2877 domain-containing protein [Verrucomicrobia bacterium]|nr:DUF2877 domain-containing protein [Verrucomicrobiota bacterium]